MKNISNKQRTINYIKFQISQTDGMIQDNKENYPNCPERNSHLYSLKNNLYKELRQITSKRTMYRKGRKDNS